MKIIIPMAGRGSRFADVSAQNPEYAKPKPLISVKGEPMIRWAVTRTFPTVPYADFIFVILKAHQRKYHIADTLQKLFSRKIGIVLIEEPTRGAAETALAAKDIVAPTEDVIISDSDHYFDTRPLLMAIHTKSRGVAGIIPVDRPVDDEVKHSYTLANDQNIALAVAEKDPELARKGAYSNIGSYYFSTFELFAREVRDMIGANEMHGPQGRKEFYVAPIYQRLIDRGLTVKVAPTRNAWRLGTPQDIDYFNTQVARDTGASMFWW